MLLGLGPHAESHARFTNLSPVFLSSSLDQSDTDSGLLWAELCPPRPRVEDLKSRTPEHGSIWRLGLKRGSEVTRSSSPRASCR